MLVLLTLTALAMSEPVQTQGVCVHQPSGWTPVAVCIVARDGAELCEPGATDAEPDDWRRYDLLVPNRWAGWSVEARYWHDTTLTTEGDGPIRWVGWRFVSKRARRHHQSPCLREEVTIMSGHLAGAYGEGEEG